MNLRINGIQRESVVDGPGLRYVIFTQGCPHNCPGCHNPQTHPVEGGEEKNTEEIIKEILDNPLLRGVTFSGGEPFLQSKALVEIARAIKKRGKNIWCYSGFTYENLMKKHDGEKDLLRMVDVLVDGPFEIEKRSLNLQFRGSHNQRIIHLKDGIIEKIIK